MAHALAHVLAILSALLSALFLLGVFRPRSLMAVARNVLGRTGVAGAVGVRLVLAALLWYSAPLSSTPGGFRVLATVMLVAAFSAFVLGKDRAVRITERMAGWRPAIVRIPIVAGLAVCLFMLWSVSPAIGGF